MLQNTIPAYPYQQYADDDNIQAFFAAYNGAAQYYVTWFATISLPYYPGLTDGLLDWVAQGLYGLARTALQSQATPSLGPLNTEPLNTATLNSFIFAVTTYYALSDDVLGRILTWDFYKGDGKRFNARWLKRRIMRFLTWPFGAPPDPQVGPENTQAISVQISAGLVCTVTINQALVSRLVPNLPANLLQIFQAAFQGGTLELPAQYTYVCVIQTHPVVTPAPSSTSAFGATSTLTTPAVAVSVSGGSGLYTFAWTWQSGGTGITINSPSSFSTSFTANGLAAGNTDSGIALCTVTDTITALQTTCTVPVSIQRASMPAISVTPSSISVFGVSSTESGSVTSVTESGGAAPFTYAWTWQSGGAGITIGSPSSALTSFTATGLAPGSTDSGTALLTVTDALGQTATATVAVSLGRATGVGGVITPSSITYTNALATETTPVATASASGGAPPYSYNWSFQSGGAGMSINSPTFPNTTFRGTGLTPGASFSAIAACVVQDSLGQTATLTLPVTINRATVVSASVSPSSVSSTAVSGTQTTGAATVTASGGGTPYSYAWAWSSGGAGIAINAPSSAATSFTATGLTPGTTRSGVALCTVTDIYGQMTQQSVNVTITYPTAPSASASPTSLSYTNALATESTGASTVTASGGIAPYSYAWTWQSGGAGIAINSPAANATTFTASGLSPGQTDSGTALCTVTDAIGQQTTATCAVSISRVTLITASVSPGSESSTGATANQTTGTATVTTSGGGTVYTYFWSWQSGGAGITINTPASSATSFSAGGLNPGNTVSGTAQCTVTDQYGQFSTVTVSVSITRVTTVTLGVSPSSQSSSQLAASQTTGVSTATPSGGQSPYTYSWTWGFGGAGITINSPTAAATSFTASGLSPGQSVSGTALCTVTDAFGQVANNTVSVVISYPSTPVTSTSPTSQTSSGTATTQTTGTSTVSVSGGVGPYTYAWTWLVGGSGIAINSPSSNATSFTASGMTPGVTYSGTAECTVTDSLGQHATGLVSVSILCQGTTIYSNRAAAVVSIPSGATQLTIEGWAEGGQGGAGDPVDNTFGGGGQAGGYFRSTTYTLTSANWGQTFNISSTLPGAGQVLVTSGTFSLTTKQVVTGGSGFDGTSAGSGAGGSGGGQASGGEAANITGTNGAAGTFTAPGAGAQGTTGVYAGPYGAGGNGSGINKHIVGGVPAVAVTFA